MTNTRTDDRSPWSVFLIFLRLGLTSFGGPIAHLGYFRDEFVTRRRWLSERSYADLVALCQFLPGPASSQVGIALGLSRTGGVSPSWRLRPASPCLCRLVGAGRHDCCRWHRRSAAVQAWCGGVIE